MKRQPPSRRGDSIEDAVTGQFHRDKDTVDDAISQDFGAEGNETTIGVPEGVDLRRDAFEAAPTELVERVPELADERTDADAVPVPHEPLQMISMKTPIGEPRPEKKSRRLPKVKIRGVEPAAASKAPPRALGHLAPPRDPGEARVRRLRDFVIWGALVVILATLVSITIWLLAGG
jgi:hypothetical protein